MLRSRPVGWLALMLVLAPGTGSAAGTLLAHKAAPGGSLVRRVPDPAGDAELVVPAGCQRHPCPLVVVSHSRGGRPEDGINRAHHGRYASFLGHFTRAGYALLLVADGGGQTWGSPRALDNDARVWARARTMFRYSGETFTMGLSMGGLPAALLGLTRRLPVRGTVLVAGRVNLAEAYWGRSDSRARAIALAYGVAAGGGFEELDRHDPLNNLASFPRTSVPTLAVGSWQDRIVPLETNGAAYVAGMRATEPRSRLVVVRGGHLAGDHLSANTAETALAFLAGLRVRPVTVITVRKAVSRAPSP